MMLWWLDFLKEGKEGGEGEGLCNIILEGQEQEGDGHEGEEKQYRARVNFIIFFSFTMIDTIFTYDDCVK